MEAPGLGSLSQVTVLVSGGTPAAVRLSGAAAGPGSYYRFAKIVDPGSSRGRQQDGEELHSGLNASRPSCSYPASALPRDLRPCLP